MRFSIPKKYNLVRCRFDADSFIPLAKSYNPLLRSIKYTLSMQDVHFDSMGNRHFPHTESLNVSNPLYMDVVDSKVVRNKKTLRSNLHDQMIDKVAKTLRDKGFNVIRLDKCNYPDLILTQSEESIALEVQLRDIRGKIRNILSKSEFKKTLIVSATKISPIYPTDLRIKTHVKKPEFIFELNKEIPKRWIAYLLSIELRKRKYSYLLIQQVIMDKFNLHISKSTLSDWLHRGVKPSGFEEYVFQLEITEKKTE